MSKRMKVMLVVYLIVFLVAGYAFLNDYNVINIEKDIAESLVVDEEDIDLASNISLDNLELFAYKTMDGIGLSGYNCLVNTFCDRVLMSYRSFDEGDVFSTYVETNEQTYILFYGRNEANHTMLRYTLEGDQYEVSLPLSKLYFITYKVVDETVALNAEPSNIVFE